MKIIARIAAPALLAVSLLSAAPAANAAEAPLPTCDVTLSNAPCRAEVVQTPGEVPGSVLRSIDGSTPAFVQTEAVLSERLDRCMTGVRRLSAENSDYFFEVQDLRPRVQVAETNLALAEKKIDAQAEKIARLRARLHAAR